MIERIRIQNYKALRDVTLHLTPIHVLIGANDTGKTSILEAIAALCRSVDHPLASAFLGRWKGDELIFRESEDRTVRYESDFHNDGRQLKYQLRCEFGPKERHCKSTFESIAIHGDPGFSHSVNDSCTVVMREANREARLTDEKQRESAQDVAKALAGILICRWDPRMLALPVAQDSKRQFAIDSNGFGLALLLDDILNHSREQFTKLEDRFRHVFPQVKSIRLKREAAFTSPFDDPLNVPMLQRQEGKGIYFAMGDNGSDVSAAQVSDGLLIVLAYLAVLYLPKAPRIILVEEPENGIHPERLEQVINILREVVAEQGKTQIILTTHSPYLLDFFQPEEVTLCTRGEDGAVSVHPLSESETVRKQAKVFSLGEIWTGEGDDALANSSNRSSSS